MGNPFAKPPPPGCIYTEDKSQLVANTSVNPPWERHVYSLSSSGSSTTCTPDSSYKLCTGNNDCKKDLYYKKKCMNLTNGSTYECFQYDDNKKCGCVSTQNNYMFFFLIVLMIALFTPLYIKK